MNYYVFFLLASILLDAASINFFHDEAGADISGKLSYGGFSQILQVYIGTPPQPYNCIVHGGDSFIVVNFDPNGDGWISSTFFDSVINSYVMYFRIGSFEGHLPVIYSSGYVYSFNNSAVSCVIGLGRANSIYWRSPKIHITPTNIFFNELSDSKSAIRCERYDTALCTFNAVYKLNDTVIGYAPTQLSNTVPYTLLPVDIFNQVLLLSYTTNYWNTITICNDSCIEIPSASYLLRLHNYMQKTIFSTTANRSTIGVTVMRNLDISIDSTTAIMTTKERSFTLINSYGVFIVWIFFVGVYGFLILSPNVRHMRIPRYVKMFSGVRTIAEIVVLVVPFFIFAIPDYYNNFVLEFEWFHYMFMAYIGTISLLGFASIVLNEVMAGFSTTHYYLPIISCVNIILLLSLFDFQEGSPNLIQSFYSFIIGNYLFAIAASLLDTITLKQLLYVPAGLFFGAMAIGWSMFASTYFIIPTIQKIIMLDIKYLYILWPAIVLVSAILGVYHCGALMCQLHIWAIRGKYLALKIKNS